MQYILQVEYQADVTSLLDILPPSLVIMTLLPLSSGSPFFGLPWQQITKNGGYRLSQEGVL